jgi:1-deoxy-D-xylulose-5-phosphate synthase
MAILVPSDEAECRMMLQTAYEHVGPTLVRYPRGAGIGAAVGDGFETLPWGRAERMRDGNDIALLAFGPLLHTALEVGERLNASVINMRFVKPLDERILLELATEHRLLVTIEENVVQGGAGSAVNEALHAAGVTVRVLNLGLPDRFIEQASQDEQREMAGLSAAQIEARVRKAIDEQAVDMPSMRAHKRG